MNASNSVAMTSRMSRSRNCASGKFSPKGEAGLPVTVQANRDFYAGPYGVQHLCPRNR